MYTSKILGILVFSAVLSVQAQMIIRTDRPTMRLSEQAKSALIESISSRITTRYLFPDLADKMTKNLRQKFRDGEFRELSSPVDFAQQVTRTLQETSHDRHTSVAFDPRMAQNLLANEKLPEENRQPPV